MIYELLISHRNSHMWVYFYMSWEKKTRAKQRILKIFNARQKIRIWQICPFCFFFLFFGPCTLFEKRYKQIKINFYHDPLELLSKLWKLPKILVFSHLLCLKTYVRETRKYNILIFQQKKMRSRDFKLYLKLLL